MEVFAGYSDCPVQVMPASSYGVNNCGLNALAYFGIIKNTQYDKIRQIFENPNGMFLFEDLGRICAAHPNRPNLICLSPSNKEFNTRLAYTGSKECIFIVHDMDHYEPIEVDEKRFLKSVLKNNKNNPEFIKVVKKIIN